MQYFGCKEFWTLSWIVAAFGALTVPTQAALLDQYFTGDRNSCYKRIYSSEHLRTHPDQTVKSIEFRHFPKLWGTYGADGKVRFDEKKRDVYFAIAVRFRRSSETFEESGVCSRKNGVLRCGIECDGGGFELKARKDGRLLLKTGSYGFRVVRRGEGCGGDDASVHHVTRKTDDRVFLLSRQSDLSCLAPK